MKDEADVEIWLEVAGLSVRRIGGFSGVKLGEVVFKFEEHGFRDCRVGNYIMRKPSIMALL